MSSIPEYEKRGREVMQGDATSAFSERICRHFARSRRHWASFATLALDAVVNSLGKQTLALNPIEYHDEPNNRALTTVA